MVYVKVYFIEIERRGQNREEKLGVSGLENQEMTKGLFALTFHGGSIMLTWSVLSL